MDAVKIKRIKILKELAAVILVFAVGYTSAYLFSKTRNRADVFPQVSGPAALFACGYGFAHPFSGWTPEFADFLLNKRESVQCSELVDEKSFTSKPLTIFERHIMHLLLLVGIYWKLTGSVAWSALIPITSFMFAVSISLAYGLLRLRMGRLISIAGAVMFAFSTLHLRNTLNIRDYAKEPFILAAILILRSP